MSQSDDLAELLQRLRHGDEQAAQQLWDAYFQRIVRVAAGRMPGSLKRAGDEEDVALSALHSFVAGLRADRFPDLHDPEGLWRLLMVLTTRKVQAHLRHSTRIKRGGGRVRGESVFLGPDPSGAMAGIQALPGDAREPDLEAELTDACQRLLEQLDDDQLRTIALLRGEGYLVDEIAAMLELSKRAVERRLQLIRKIWTETADGASDTRED